MPKIDFGRLQDILDKCGSLAVGFSLTYEESADTWYFTVESAAQSERYIGKSRPFEFACKDIEDWLSALGRA